MGRLIKLEGAGKERTQLTRSIVLAIRELMRQEETNDQTHDLAAFIALALEAIASKIDISVAAWEKRGYWVKADRFRLDWEWTARSGKNMRQAVIHEDWPSVARISVEISGKLKNIEIPKRKSSIPPWEGAWKVLNELELRGSRSRAEDLST